MHKALDGGTLCEWRITMLFAKHIGGGNCITGGIFVQVTYGPRWCRCL